MSTDQNVIHLATSRERPAVRACATCVHHGRWFEPARCDATGLTDWVARSASDAPCGREGHLWEPRPPRRSLARWIYDVFFAWGGER